MSTREEKLEAFGRLLDVMDELRAKCPWDAKQTNESLRPNTIEEVYELSEAILKNEKDELVKELGDVLLHIIFYAKIGEEKNDFDVKSVCDKLCEKLIFRHPHVFGTTQVDGSKQVEQNWEALKLKEKGGNKTVLSGVPTSLPAMIKAQRIQEKARNAGFDWEEREQVWEKVQEEINEVKAEIAFMNQEKMEAEFGDLIFSIINTARLYHINPDSALERTNQKFISRFNYLESKSLEQGRKLKEMTLDEMECLWQEAKKRE
ncbi:MAG: nucleoside triphosphate pyrophosphohydrolase [Bacteroidales bacterium]|nr:nucleoside triphosphate pyrophosphohydrolase [Bacteroidales bacterium]